MSSQHKSVLCQYRYDPLDRLVNQARPDVPVYQRFYCKSRLATEIQGAVHHSIIQHGDLLLAQQRRESEDISATLLATDVQRSVLHTLGKNHQQQSIAYSPYGHRHVENGLTSLLGFNGERPDPVTGHYLLGNGYRAFNPVLMRFNSPDSWSPFGEGGLNSYAYCLGNPTTSRDPTGHVAFIQKPASSFSQPRTVRLKDSFGSFSPPLTIRPGISTTRAAKAFSKLTELDYGGSDQIVQNIAYLEELTTARIASNNSKLNLQKLSIDTIQSKSIPTNALPPKLQEISRNITPHNERHVLLEYIETGKHAHYDGDSGPFSHAKLLRAKSGEYHPSTPLNLRPTLAAAKEYWDHILAVRNPKKASFEAKALAIRDIHFLLP